MRLSQYLLLLERAGQTGEQRRSISESMRRQEITSVMYLPEIAGAMEESVGLFGDVRSQPVDGFRAGERFRLFRLTDFGFYLFLFKLSIHFTRMQDGVNR
jgi:hypothetical protein